MNTARNKQQNHRRQAYKIDPHDHATINFVCRKKDSSQDRSIVRARHVGGLRKLFALRHGYQLPNSRDGRKHLFALLQNLAGLQYATARTLVREIENLAPWMSEKELLGTIARVGSRPTTHRGVTLGKIVGLVDAEREACGCWSIWPIDLSLAEAELRKRERDCASKAEKRKAAGAKPRAESLARTEPWKAEGKSRSKWFEDRKRAKETKEADLKERAEAILDDFVVPISMSCNIEPVDAPKESRAIHRAGQDATLSPDDLNADADDFEIISCP